MSGLRDRHVPHTSAYLSGEAGCCPDSIVDKGSRSHTIREYCEMCHLGGVKVMSEIEVQGGVLKVRGDLYWDNEDEFVLAMEKLLASPGRQVGIDISEVGFLFSPFVSHLVRFCLTAKDKGKEPEVIIGPNLVETFEVSGLVSELPIRCIQPS